MKVVILAGGLGSRLAEETSVKPKPMVEIGGMPIIWHIMKIYHYYGFTDFIICCGYKGYVIKEFFINYSSHSSDITVSTKTGKILTNAYRAEPWEVTLCDTGATSMTGGRLLAIRKYLEAGETFCMTYGDGLSNIDIAALLTHHQQSGKLATITAVQPPGRFGAIEMSGDMVSAFLEKPAGHEGWINGGFFVLNEKVLDYVESTSTIWENDPLEKLVESGELSAFRHEGFWRAMDTLRDKNYLEDLWGRGEAAWKIW
jgi:glucose-1-phosphate cytidylyltransferase